MKHRPYYVDLGRSCDYVNRCEDCKKLVTHEYLRARGSCPCGHRRMTEVRTLTLWEWLKIKTGWLRFGDSDKFLKEFSRVR